MDRKMWEVILSALFHVGSVLWDATVAISVPAAIFVALAVIVKGRGALAAAYRAAGEMRINVQIYVLDALIVAPCVVGLIAGMAYVLDLTQLRVLQPGQWDVLPKVAVAFAAVFAGDLVGYWRHRLEHTHLLWPSHAIHHSDTEISWLTIFRFHPINRLSTTLIDFGLLLILGFPEYALVASVFVRHHYGYLIHADLPWTLGKFGCVFVSPVMHQWHHARDPAAYSSNFATVFSIFDRLFGTLHMPGPCKGPLGVNENMGEGFIGQLRYPFRLSSYSRSVSDAVPIQTKAKRNRWQMTRKLAESDRSGVLSSL
jgi:sterol desaturase/sphingolipid hydroxylase (fatty acid hydroxylase superfamily)